jgi:UDP-glucose 4-epimerase
MTSLITGGAGFMGAHVALRCLSQGHQVVILDDLSGGYVENIPKNAIFIKGSILDTALVSKLFTEYKFDYVYHLAAYAAEGLSHFIRNFNYQNNLIGSINLINESIKHEVKCFVFTSSIAVYGTNQVPMTENTTPKPEDPYGISKYAIEMDLQSAHEMFGLNYVIFRPHNVYGEYQNIGDRYRNVIGIFMNQLMNKQPMSIFGDGLQTRAFSYISDVSPFIVDCVEKPEAFNQIFNVGGDVPYTVLQVAQMVANFFNVEPVINYLPARNEVVHAFSDHAKIKQYFGAYKSITLEEGINIMGRWALENGPRETKPFTNIEIRKNMPSKWAEWL